MIAQLQQKSQLSERSSNYGLIFIDLGNMILKLIKGAIVLVPMDYIIYIYKLRLCLKKTLNI
jgi:hypothetical protein